VNRAPRVSRESDMIGPRGFSVDNHQRDRKCMINAISIICRKIRCLYFQYLIGVFDCEELLILRGYKVLMYPSRYVSLRTFYMFFAGTHSSETTR
jgi:hypothetical protein